MNVGNPGIPREHTNLAAAVFRSACILLSGSFILAGCNVAPKYNKPTAPTPPAYKELTPEEMKQTEGWKTAQPQDTVLHGKWWEIYQDPELNVLEEQVNVSNQSIAA